MGKPDTKSLGPSRVVPFLPGESPKDRHARRKRAAEKRISALESFAAGHNLDLRVLCGGHHFQFRSRDDNSIVAEWWPSSAKLVWMRSYDHGVHAHDHQQVMGYLSQKLTMRAISLSEDQD